MSNITTWFWLKRIKWAGKSIKLKRKGRTNGGEGLIYNLTCIIKGKKEEFVLYVNKPERKIITFQKYVEFQDLNSLENLEYIGWPEQEDAVVARDCIWFPGYVVAKQYAFNWKMNIVSYEVALRNDICGTKELGEMGKYLPIRITACS